MEALRVLALVEIRSEIPWPDWQTALVTNNCPPNMDQFDENHAAYTGSPEFPAIEAKAHALGFRKATPAEVRSSANKHTGYQELFCAFGGLWIKEGVSA